MARGRHRIQVANQFQQGIGIIRSAIIIGAACCQRPELVDIGAVRINIKKLQKGLPIGELLDRHITQEHRGNRHHLVDQTGKLEAGLVPLQ